MKLNKIVASAKTQIASNKINNVMDNRVKRINLIGSNNNYYKALYNF